MSRPKPPLPRSSQELLRDLSRPLSPHSAHYQLFRLEGLFHALQELWSLPGDRTVPQGRYLQAVTGAECVPATGGGTLRPALTLGSRICNRTLQLLVREEAGQGEACVSARIRELRGLLIALDDLVETTTADGGYRLEYDQAARELARLLGRPGDSSVDLVHACFATARSLAAEALAGLYLREVR